MDFTGIHKVEYLHHHKGVEDKGKMSRVAVSLLVNDRVIVATTRSIESTTTNSPSDHSVMPLVVWIGYVQCLTVE